MVSRRLDVDAWKRLGQAAELGLIASREYAVNVWLRRNLDDLLSQLMSISETAAGHATGGIERVAKQEAAEARQLSFDDLERQLDEHTGQLVRLPITPEDVGGELLAILSKGLYTNPLDCIREYVQNSVDARARSVTIKITGNSVLICDDGTGMGLREILQARQFGLSPKSLTEHVGFRGIGIYSGFDLCQRLRITSKKEGDPHQHVLVFDFAQMRAQLDADKRKTTDPKTPLVDLLSAYTQIGRNPLPSTVSADRHFTIVELQDISDVHIRELSNRANMKRYLLENLPIDFADGFEYRTLINERLGANVPGYNAIRIKLESDGLPDEIVAKPAVQNLQPPTFGYIITSSGKQVAYYWACLNKERGRIDERPRDRDKDTTAEERTSYEGFVYKMKGFTVGDRQKLRTMFERKPQLYPWYTGEIYVIDTDVVPNAERDDFETNPAKRMLTLAVRDKLKELEQEAERVQAQGVADDRVEKYQRDLAKLEQEIAAGEHDDYEAYSKLDSMLIDLGRQKRKASAENQKIADDITKRAKSLQKQLRRDVDTPRPTAERRKQAARNTAVSHPPTTRLFEAPLASPPKTLQGVLQDAGWTLEEDVARLVDLVQSTFDDVLVSGSPIYRSVLTDIEAKLSSNNLDA
jgi:hypothetical protein